MRRRAQAWLVLLAVVLVAGRARAEAFDLSGHDWEGCADFVQIARDEIGARAVATTRIDLAALTPEDSLILLHPDPTLDDESLAAFMRAGGRVILLDDFGSGDGLLHRFGMQRVPLPARPAEALRHNPQLAIAEPASAHPTLKDVSKVVTNHATGLSHPDLSPVLKIRAVGEPDVLVAVAGAVSQGRLLVVGDPSIVINAMLRYPGNKAFARNLVRYAADDDTWGKRGGHVYIASGAFEQSGAYGEAASTVAEWARAWKDMVASARRDGMPPWMAYLLAVTGGLAVVVWVGSRAGRTHRAVTPRYARRIPLAAQGGIAGHAAVIGGDRTSRVLAMLELKSALEEDLAVLLGLDRVPAHDVLLGRVAAAGLLPSDALSSLKRLLLRMANLETMILSQRTDGLRRIKDRDVLAVAARVKSLLLVAHDSADKKRRAA